MKYLKVVLLAIVAICTFAGAQAQHHPYHRRVAIVHHRYHRHRPVAVHHH